MNQALVKDVVAEVMRRLETRRDRGGVRAGEDAPANEGKFREAHGSGAPVGQYGIFGNVDDADAAATEAQKKLTMWSLDERDQIVKLIKSMATQNAAA